MKLSKEAEEIRIVVEEIPRGVGRRYGKVLRGRVTTWMEAATRQGIPEADWPALLGVPRKLFHAWRDRRRRLEARAMAKAAPTALVPVVVRPDALAEPLVAVAAPNGFRIEGLTLDQALHVLRLVG